MGAGSPTGDVRNLRWQDLDPDDRSVHAPGDLRPDARVLRLPEAVVPLAAIARNTRQFPHTLHGLIGEGAPQPPYLLYRPSPESRLPLRSPVFTAYKST